MAAGEGPVMAGSPPRLRLTAVLSTLLGFASISTDVFLPALPAMQVALGASENVLQLVISSYLVGFSVGQLVWGPISDRFGRRMPLVVGLLLFVAGCAGCALSVTAWQLIGFRVIQALGACSSIVIGRAIVRDLYERNEAARMLSTLMAIMAIAPLAGPIVGAFVISFASWRVIFWLLVTIGFATLAAIFSIPESLPAERRSGEAFLHSFAAYGPLFGDRRLLAYAGTLGFLYGGLFAGVAGSSFAYIGYYHLSPTMFGMIFAAGIVGLMAVNTINGRLVAKIGSDRMLFFGGIGAAASGVALALASISGIGGIWSFAISMSVFTATNGLLSANALAGAMADFPKRAGSVAALMGAIQFGFGVVSSVVSGVLANGTPTPMALVIALCGVGALGASAWIQRRSVDPV